MRYKELRIALICYGGISLAVYMHGVTKELWKMARASRALHAGEQCLGGSEAVYGHLLAELEQRGTRLRVLPDIVTGASAGGINGVFLAQALHSGHSYDPLTDLWLQKADVEELLAPEAHSWTGFSKSWAIPIVRALLSQPGNVVTESVAPEARTEVRRKLSHFVRARWFAPPFSGIGFSRMLRDGFEAMAAGPGGPPLLPPGQPLDLFVTATDFHGHYELLHLNSPAVVKESEHRLPIGFRSRTPAEGGIDFAPPLTLTLAARATASFPGAFPPARIAEIDTLAAERGEHWDGRDEFLRRILPEHTRHGDLDTVALIDGSVLVNKPIAEAMGALTGRPAQREVDRRFVYIDPRPDRGAGPPEAQRSAGFFSVIFGSISAIPREQPIRDNLKQIEEQSREAERLHRIVHALRPNVERTVEKLFGLTFFLDHPTPQRLTKWRARAQQTAAESAGFAFHGYAQAKLSGIVDRLAQAIHHSAPELMFAGSGPIAGRLHEELVVRGLDRLVLPSGGASPHAIAFFRQHDLAFRIRRMRLLSRRLNREWEEDPEVTDAAREAARDAIFAGLALLYEHESLVTLGEDFASVAERVMTEPGVVLDEISARRSLTAVDQEVDRLLSDALLEMPEKLRRRMLFAYLGFPFFDIVTLPLVRNESYTEFDPIKVDRISPEDATSIREGGTLATLRGIEFYHFGAFFSRVYRENDYLWGRLHGAERMIDLTVSSVSDALSPEDIVRFKKQAFLAVLDEEQDRLTADPALLVRIRAEILERMNG